MICLSSHQPFPVPYNVGAPSSLFRARTVCAVMEAGDEPKRKKTPESLKKMTLMIPMPNYTIHVGGIKMCQTTQKSKIRIFLGIFLESVNI